nr:hypothetical protein [Tanacetum cinerariifolium]
MYSLLYAGYNFAGCLQKVGWWFGTLSSNDSQCIYKYHVWSKTKETTSIQPTLPNNQFQSSRKGQQKVQQCISKKSQEIKSSVFRGQSFCFSNSFPDVQRPEDVDWIHEVGGEVTDTQGVKNVNHTVKSHGVLCSLT